MLELTQYEKIIKIMVNNKDHVWWLPQEFMRPDLGEYFVGYEASARLSELARLYPKMIESLRDGKYIKRRFKFEAIEEFYQFLPDKMKCMMWDAGLKENYQDNLC